MKNTLKKLTCVGALIFTQAGHAATIAVVDGSFENVVDAAGAWADMTSPWVTTLGSAGPTDYQLNNATTPSHLLAADSGIYVAYLLNSGTLTQNLATTVNAGDSLSITFAGGSSLIGGGVGGGGIGTASFVVGATSYDFSFDTTVVTPGTFQNYTFNQVITNTGNLSLKFVTASGRPWLDSVSNVTVTAVPEPSAAILGGLGALALLRRRRGLK
jgi:MYXO-CTERM domain-containing protein